MFASKRITGVAIATALLATTACVTNPNTGEREFQTRTAVGAVAGGCSCKEQSEDQETLHFFFPLAGAFAFAGALRLAEFLTGPLAARSSMSWAASSNVSASCAIVLGKVALVVPSVT